MQIRIRNEKKDPDPHQSQKQDPHRDPYQKSQNSGAVDAQNGALEDLRR
jgi:hypothetical protein